MGGNELSRTTRKYVDTDRQFEAHAREPPPLLSIPTVTAASFNESTTLDEKRAEANPFRRTRCPFAIDKYTNDIFPYDPGPLNSPPLLK
ncbi:hypothetical protein L195_g050045, partial [Trifolium pratense]